MKMKTRTLLRVKIFLYRYGRDKCKQQEFHGRLSSQIGTDCGVSSSIINSIYFDYISLNTEL